MENSSSQPTTPPSSSSKCQEEAVVENDGVDRISDLPDNLLCHILSFLPTTNAVETSILSSRWKTLWTFVPSLDLDIEYRDWEVIASKVFALHKAPYLKFHLSLIYPYNPSHVGTWVNAAISPNLEDFSLCIYNGGTGNNFYPGEPFVLPRNIFSCKNLVVLELTGPIILNLNPLSVWFPRLKVLRLDLITYNESDWRLLSGCPVLEDLCLGRTGFLIKDKEDLVKRVKFKICVPTLKRLTMFVSLSSVHLEYEFEINAPALEYFHIEGELGNVVFLEKPSNLVEANVDIYPYENYFEENPDYEERVLGLLRQLYNVKKLKLSSDTTEWLHCSHDNYNLPMFHKLARLDFEVECCNLGLLPHFLDQAPNLEALDFDMFPCSSNSRNLGCPNSRLVEPPDVPRSFLGLTTFCFRRFEGLKDQLKVARYILKNARDLKTMTLNARHILRNPKDEKSLILEKLSTFPKLSMSCQIAFD